METLTTSVYYDTSDTSNYGWAYRLDVHGPNADSGTLDGYELSSHLTRDEARELAVQAFGLGLCNQVRVYWRGDDSAAITFDAADLL